MPNNCGYKAVINRQHKQVQTHKVFCVYQIAMRAMGLEPKKQVIKQLVEESDVKYDICIEFEKFQEIIEEEIGSKTIEREVVKAFRYMDKNKNGYIQAQDLYRIATDLGMDFSDEEITRMIVEVGGDESGRISEEEFVRAVMQS